MELVVLGSGTAIPHPYRNPSGLLVKAEGHTILVDVGPGTLHRLPRAGVAFEQIREVLLTHLHIDHVLDLVCLLFAKRLPGMTNAPTLTLRGGVGLEKLVDGLQGLFHPWLEPRGYELRVKEFDGPIDLEGLRIRGCPVPHQPSSVAYRFEDSAGTSLVVSGDTEGGEALVEMARGATLLILECSFPDGEEVQGHLTPSKAGALARRAGAGKLLLTHFYPACDGRELLGPCMEAFGGEVLLAHDWMRLRVE